jgi:hypothetical protein
MPEGFRPATPSPTPAPQQEQGVSQALSLLAAIGGDPPTAGASEAPGVAESFSASQEPVAQKVARERSTPPNLPKSGENPWGVLDHAGRSGLYLQKRYGIKDIGGYRASDPFPDHPSRKALDLMVYDDAKKGNAIASDLIRNHERHGVKYLIWNQRIWHPGRGWRKMEDRGSPTQNHQDHVHVLYE